MADFCKQCSIDHFGQDFRELAGLSKPQDTANKLYANVICEGCGHIQVDHEGVCVTTNCLVGDHNKPKIDRIVEVATAEALRYDDDDIDL